jgi:hypothetical protein
MTTKALARMFSYLGAVLAVLAIGAWVNSQGGPNIFHYVSFDERPTIDAYYAIFAISALLIIAALALAFYSRRQTDGWLNRIPVVRFSDKFPFVASSAAQPEQIGRRGFIAYQSATLVLVLLIPAASLFHLNQYLLNDRGRVWNAAVRSVDSAPVRETIPFLWPTAKGRAVLDSPAQNNGKADFRLADRIEDIETEQHRVIGRPEPKEAPSDLCKDHFDKCTGVTWFPIWSPLLLWTLTLAAWICTAWAFFMIFRVSKPKHPGGL